jgi:hypothetical protein
VSARVLQIAFGWRGQDELVLLDIDEMRQYHEQAAASLWFASEALRTYVEEHGELPPAIEQGDSPLAVAIRDFAAALNERQTRSKTPSPT